MTIDLATINFIPGQGGGVIKSLSVTSNGVYSVPAGVDGYNPVDVDVHPSESLQRTYTSNGSYNITGEFKDGVITVDVPATQFITETLSVSSNGTYTPSEGVNGYSQVVVDVPIDGWDQKNVTEGTIEIINLDNSASFVASSAFMNNNTIQTVNLPYATRVGIDAFSNCSSLQTVSLPACTTVGNYAFRYCSSLQTVDLPVCSNVGDYAFKNCSSLQTVSLPVCTTVGWDVFQDCSSLSVIYIGTSIDTVCVLGNSDAFWGCSALTSIYVPASLVESYKAATNWTYFSDKIVGI